MITVSHPVLRNSLFIVYVVVAISALAGCGAEGLRHATLAAESARTQGATYIAGAIGDSITAATLADTSASDSRSPFHNVGVQNLQERALYENKDTLSWFSGKDIASHFKLLSEFLSVQHDASTIQVLNGAVPGTTSDKIQSQVDDLVSATQQNGGAVLKYVSIMIGANDACSAETAAGTPNDRMYTNLMTAFKKLASVQQAEPIRVLVSSIPDIAALNRPEISNFTTVDGLSCHFVRHQLLGFCDPLLDWKTPEEYAGKLKIITDKNELLRRVVGDANAAFTNLQVVYSDSFFQHQIRVDELAEDCFHPNERSQGALAARLWADQPWFH
jgi:lysophospholipase L1-like esterase